MKQSAVPSGKRWRQSASTSETTSFFAYLLKFRNMYRFYLLYCLFLCLGNILFAQTTGFEKGVPQSFCTVQSNELSSSEEFYKEGKRSLAWQFSPRSVLTVQTRYSPTSGLRIKRKARDYTMDLQRTSQKRFTAL